MARSKRPTTAQLRAGAERLAAQAAVEQAAMTVLAMGVEETALVLGISPWLVRHLCATGKLPGADRTGRRWRIPPSAIRHRLASRTNAKR